MSATASRAVLHNGDIVETLQNGTTITTKKNDYKIEQRADGSRVQTNPDGTQIETSTNGDKKQVNPDGSTFETFADGRTKKVYPDGVVVEVDVDGTRTQTNANGTVVVLRKDGSRKQTNFDGKCMENLADGTIIQTDPDGSRFEDLRHKGKMRTMPAREQNLVDRAREELQNRPRKPLASSNDIPPGGKCTAPKPPLLLPDNFNGLTILESTKLKDGRVLEKNDNGSLTQRNPDGTAIYSHHDGTKLQINPDGTRLFSHPDGYRRQETPAGIVLEMFPDGSTRQTETEYVIIVRPNKSILQKSILNGSIIEKNADGTMVKSPDEVEALCEAEQDGNPIKPPPSMLICSFIDTGCMCAICSAIREGREAPAKPSLTDLAPTETIFRDGTNEDTKTEISPPTPPIEHQPSNEQPVEELPAQAL